MTDSTDRQYECYACAEKDAEIERLRERLDAEYAKGDKLAQDTVNQQFLIVKLEKVLDNISRNSMDSSTRGIAHAAIAEVDDE